MAKRVPPSSGTHDVTPELPGNGPAMVGAGDCSHLVRYLLDLRERAQGIVGSCLYNARLFDAATMRTLLRDFQAVLEAIAAEQNGPLRPSEHCVLSVHDLDLKGGEGIRNVEGLGSRHSHYHCGGY